MCCHCCCINFLIIFKYVKFKYDWNPHAPEQWMGISSPNLFTKGLTVPVFIKKEKPPAKWIYKGHYTVCRKLTTRLPTPAQICILCALSEAVHLQSGKCLKFSLMGQAQQCVSFRSSITPSIGLTPRSTWGSPSGRWTVSQSLPVISERAAIRFWCCIYTFF